ncbi:MAG: DPP IV N-terminal domain-containing protein [Candidatus Poribacteria bacterium]|nr:DPP IV N-terminal domain-containing protein [Candidatus Poribacteria bacterium]MDE0503061.1 DPP IV N-terminal domain-containing protein [Candidatus Poribacteria bacterium]
MNSRQSKRTSPRRIIAVSLFAASVLTALNAFSEGGKIAFTSNRDGKQAIYIMNSDGGNPVRLSSGSHPSWSPDGKRIAFSFGLNRFRGDISDILVMNADGKNRVNLTKGRHKGNRAPDWSPDGEKIAFMSNRSGQTNIYVMDADGKHTVNLTPGFEFAHSPDWSPDGKRIVFGADGDIFVMNARGADRMNLTQNPRASDLTPSWSPDGRKIAYSASPKPGLWFAPYNIYVMNADGTHPVMLTEERRWAYEYTPSWSNDGTRIVYDRQEPDGTSDVYAINADGSGAANLTRTPRVSDHSASWRPSGLSVPRTARLVTSWCELKGAR